MLEKETSRTLKVDYLARVEGEGSIFMRLEGHQAKEVRLQIFEPPRFFEGFLRGRAQSEAPDITARICGICPVAYQMSSCHAIERALGVTVGGELRKLRRLLYTGEYIESHALHLFMLHAPDFLGYEDALLMAKDHPGVVKRGLRMKKIGNSLVEVLGGREIHPINVRLGGFYRLPARSELEALLPELEWGLEAARETVSWTAGLAYPEFEQDYEFVSLRHPDEYPVNEGRIVSNKGLDIPVDQYDEVFVEEHDEHSTSLRSHIKGRGPYLTGPMARFNLNFDRLRPAARQAALRAGLEPMCRNPFKSLIVRAIELVQVFDEAIAIIREYQPPAEPHTDIPMRAGTGHAVTEAPRGMLFHRYTVAADGIIQDAKIVAPTSQNQRIIEEDLRLMAPQLADLDHARATWMAEQAVRNYDPCISCSCHFLHLHIERE